MTYEDLISERNDYISKLKDLCIDGSMGGLKGMEYYTYIYFIDKLLLKYFDVKLKFEYSDVINLPKTKKRPL